MKTEVKTASTIRRPVRGAQAPPVNPVIHIKRPPTAIIYCEGNFAGIDGKTANGLVRHSQAYRILSVIDSRPGGQDSGEVLDDGSANGIPIFASLDAAVADEAVHPRYADLRHGALHRQTVSRDRGVILDAIARGMNIVSGLHEYLGDDAEIAAAADRARCTIRDIRKPKPSKDMRLFDGSVAEV